MSPLPRSRRILRSRTVELLCRVNDGAGEVIAGSYAEEWLLGVREEQNDECHALGADRARCAQMFGQLDEQPACGPDPLAVDGHLSCEPGSRPLRLLDD